MVVDKCMDSGISAYDLLVKLVWPTMELVQTLYREDRINVSALNLATRLNRSICDQLCSKLERNEPNGNLYQLCWLSRIMRIGQTVNHRRAARSATVIPTVGPGHNKRATWRRSVSSR